MKKNSPGCATTDCCNPRPCCSVVWDLVREDYSTITVALNGTTGSLATGNPMTATATIYESFTAGGLTFYQCSAGASVQEEYDGGGSTLPRRGRAYFGTVDPNTGIATPYYADGGISLETLACLPSLQFRVTGRLRYLWVQASDPASTLTGLGYALDPTFVSFPVTAYRYFKTVGDFTDSVIVEPGTGFWNCAIRVEYLKVLTSSADVMGSIPNPLTLSPDFNPHPMSCVIAFS